VISDTETRSARERLLAAADKLFYAEGIHVVGIDRVIEEAGVAKASLYACFGSKEGLIVAFIEGRLQRRKERTHRALAELTNPRDRLIAVFDVLDTFIKDPGFNGCTFMNVSAESPPGGAVAEAARASRTWSLSLFTELARDAGATDPEALAHQLAMLYDGALVSSQMDHDRDAAQRAKAAAAALVDAATRRRRSSR
jgi:AcrR family transcriptional regulator